MFPCLNERIEIDPRVCGDEPVIKGTRVPVASLLEQLAAGQSWDSLVPFLHSTI